MSEALEQSFRLFGYLKTISSIEVKLKSTKSVDSSIFFFTTKEKWSGFFSVQILASEHRRWTPRGHHFSKQNPWLRWHETNGFVFFKATHLTVNTIGHRVARRLFHFLVHIRIKHSVIVRLVANNNNHDAIIDTIFTIIHFIGEWSAKLIHFVFQMYSTVVSLNVSRCLIWKFTRISRLT